MIVLLKLVYSKSVIPLSLIVLILGLVTFSADAAGIRTSFRLADSSPVKFTSDGLLSILFRRGFEIDKLINQCVAQGKLSTEKEAVFRFELNDLAIAQIKGKLRDGILSYEDAVELCRSFDGLNTSIAHASGVKPLPSLTFVDDTNGGIRIIVDASGNVVAMTKVSPEAFTQTLDTRTKELEAIIADARQLGTLTEQEARHLRSELNAIGYATLASHVQGSQVPYANAVVVARQLDTFGNDVATMLQVTPIVPLIAGSHFTMYNGQVIVLDEITKRRMSLELKIQNGLSSDYLSSDDAAQLKAQMDCIAMIEAKLRADGDLDFKESRVLFKGFDRVANKLDTKVAAIQSGTLQ